MQPLSQFHKDLGVVYTPEILVNYICQTTIHQHIIEELSEFRGSEVTQKTRFLDIDSLDPNIQHKVLGILSEITILDPAVGAGYFLLSSFKVLEDFHKALIRTKVQDKAINDVIENIIIKCLFGVDISLKTANLCLETLYNHISLKYPMIDKLRLKKSLKQQIKCGNALIGNTFNELMTSSDEKQVLNFNWDKEYPSVHNAGGFSICIGNPPWNILKPLEKEFFSRYDSQLSKYGVDKQKAKKIIANLLKDNKISIEWNNYRSDIQRQAKYFKKYYRFQSGKINTGKTTRNISGDLNLYKLFLERSFLLLRKKGTSGLIIPSGFHSDAGTKGLRSLIFDQNQVKQLLAFENRQGIFPSIHKSFKFDILIYQNNSQSTNTFQSTFMKRDPAFLIDRGAKLMELSWQKIKEYSPSSWSILEFKTEQDKSIVMKMYKFPVIGDSISFSREFDMSIDSHYFNTDREGFPIYEGKMIHQFDHKFKDPRYWIKEKRIIERFFSSYNNFKSLRLVFRAVAASTNQRTMISTLIPPNCCCGNSVIIVNNDSQEMSIRDTHENLLFLSGIFNSFVFDYLLRLKVSQNLNMFFIRDLPLPIITNSDSSFQQLTALVSSIYSEYEEFKSVFDNNNKFSEKYSKLSFNEKRALIDAEVAKLYELSFNELEYILDQFHISDTEKEKNLTQQKRLILKEYTTI
jgi:Alw26I/Eco31I/Esp3I family type II restriction m6 adenine DNA methyltransferase